MPEDPQVRAARISAAAALRAARMQVAAALVGAAVALTGSVFLLVDDDRARDGSGRSPVPAAEVSPSQRPAISCRAVHDATLDLLEQHPDARAAMAEEGRSGIALATKAEIAACGNIEPLVEAMPATAAARVEDGPG